MATPTQNRASAMQFVTQGHASALDTLFGFYKKFREVSRDKISYVTPGSDITSPEKVTVTSLLPTPRKGNPGAVKTTLNFHKPVVLDEGTALERKTQAVVKIDFSIPVGTSDEVISSLFHEIACVAIDGANLRDLVKNAQLPQD